jgi:hypothetical protein
VNFTDIAQFSQVAPFLVNPLVLVGFGLFLAYGLYQGLLKAGILVPLSQDQSSAIVRLMLNHGFAMAFLVIVLGFAFEAWHKKNVPVPGQQPSFSVTDGNHNQNIQKNDGTATQKNDGTPTRKNE